jgi:hypothetical protein
MPANDWLTLSHYEGAGGAQSNDVRIITSVNNGDERTATITLAAGNLRKDINVMQDAAPRNIVITVDPHLVIVSHAATVEEVTVISTTENGADAPNGAWTLNVPDGNNWLKLSLDPDGIGAQKSLSGKGTQSIYLVIDENDIMLPRSTKIYLNSNPSDAMVEVNQGAYSPSGGSGELLYIAEDGTLSIGIWGYKVTQENLLMFKFGSVIGMVASGSDDWVESNVKFNTTGADYSNYRNIPAFTESDWSVVSRRDISDPSYHNGANVKIGKGDPCKLIGLKVLDIKNNMSADDISNYDSKWHMATADENVDFVGAPTKFYVPGGGYDILLNNDATYWGPGPLGNSNGGWFPIPGERNQEVDRTDLNTDMSGFLPVFGYRDFAGKIAKASTGYYWSSTAASVISGYYMDINSGMVRPASSAVFDWGFTVRCVRK